MRFCSLQMSYFKVEPPLGRQLLSGMCPVKDLEVLPLDQSRQEEHPDGEEGEQEEGEDHLDVRPGPEAEEAEKEKLDDLE